MANDVLSYNTETISTIADDLKSLNAKYQAGIDDINSTVDNKLAECSGEIYEDFRTMYHDNLQVVLDQGTEIISRWAKVLGVDIVDTLVDASIKVKNSNNSSW